MRAVLVTSLAAALIAGCAATATTPTGLTAVPSQVPPAIEQQLQQIGHVIDPPKTAALYAPLQQHEPYAGVRVTRGERYGPDPERNLLDVFAPEMTPARPRPVLVFVHGGGFTAGARRTGNSPFYDNIALWAVHHGMIGVTTTYRLAPRHPWPAAQEDLAATVAWVRANIARLGGDPDRIYLMGHSAGGAHVALYVGHPQFHAQGSIAGAIVVSGLFDPASATPSPGLRAYFGGDASVYASRSALPGLVASHVPVLIAFSELDPPDFPKQAEQAHAALCRAGHCGRLLELRGHSHMSEVYSINTADTALTDAIRDFVRP